MRIRASSLRIREFQAPVICFTLVVVLFMGSVVMRWSSAYPLKIVLAAAALIILGYAAGCGSDNLPSLQKVRGSVKYKGKSLDHGRVTFMPERGTPGPPAVGAIQPDGSFRMQTEEKEGVAQGRHRVLVQCREIPAPSAKPQLALLKSLIPEKYSSDASPLHFEVKTGENDYLISLE
jgi:hypothetical protein